MPGKFKKAKHKASKVSEAKVAMTYRLSPKKVADAQKVLGAPTATAAIEQALDLVVFRKELIDGARVIHGLEIINAFPDG